jgi:hypothetical protein
MDSSSKIRVKIGDHEFEAEGPAAEVAKQFAAWKELIAAITSGPHPPRSPELSKGDDKSKDTGKHHSQGTLRIFALDEKRKLVTLKAHPTTDSRNADALLLLLYGFKELQDMDEVPVTTLGDAVKVSGISVARIDRAIASYVGTLVLKTGRAKGSKYRLSNTGLTEAEQLAKQMSEMFAR